MTFDPSKLVAVSAADATAIAAAINTRGARTRMALTAAQRAAQRHVESAPQRSTWLDLADDSFDETANASASDALLAALYAQHPEGGHRAVNPKQKRDSRGL